MKAIVLNEIHEPIALKEVSIPEPSTGEVCIQLKASALNHRDVWVQKGLYPGMKLPCILGSDGVGTVVKMGDGIVEDLVGEEVIINPGMFWGENPDVASKDFVILGMPINGTFAEFVNVPFEYVHAKPEHLSIEQAAALPLAGVTAYRALFTKAGLLPEEKVFINGIGGGVALMALVFAVANDCEVYVSSSSDEKIEKAIALGAKGGINYKTEKWSKKLIKEAGYFDVIIDGAGGDNFASLVDIAAPGGRISIYGGTAGNISNVLPPKIFFKQLKIMGTTMGTQTDFDIMLHFVDKYEVEPVIDKIYPLSEAKEAFKRMEDGKQFGKIILKH
ncbi:MAG: alcohol dehydrogenase [Thalassobius sp.]|nr:alcohol dehydrogenase [Thalassovita sp.]